MVEMVRDSEIVFYEGQGIRLFKLRKMTALGKWKTFGEGVLCLLWGTQLGLIMSEDQGIERLRLLGSI